MKSFILKDELPSFELRQMLEDNNEFVVKKVAHDGDKQLTLYRCPTCGREYLETNAGACSDSSDDFFLDIVSSEILPAFSRWHGYIEKRRNNDNNQGV